MNSNAILALGRQAYIAVLRNEIRKYEVPVYGFVPMHHRIMADKKRAELDLIVSTSFPEPGEARA